MGMIRFRYDPELVERFLRFPFDIYRGDGAWIPPMADDVRRQLSPGFSLHRKSGNHHRHFLATAGSRVVGRVTASVNADLTDRDGIPVGLVGFFECVNDGTVASDLLDNAVGYLRDSHGIRRIWGPVNFDIWHGYRFMTDGFGQKPFLGEPYNKPWYPDLLRHYGFSVRQEWDSVRINGAEAIGRMIQRGTRRYQDVLDRGYRFVPFGTGDAREERRILFTLIEKSFGGFLGFTPLRPDEFEEVFALKSRVFDPRLLVMVRDEKDEPVGFAGAYPELSDAVRAAGGRGGFAARIKYLFRRPKTDHLVFYFGGITPEQEKKRTGTGRAGFVEILKRAVRLGYDRVTIALMARDSRARGFAAGSFDGSHRQYALYQLDT